MTVRKEVLELLAMGAVLGGRRDLLEGMPEIVRTPKGRSLCSAMAAAAEGNADVLYDWFREHLKVDLDRGPERIVDAIVAELEETARLDRESIESFSKGIAAAKQLAKRMK